MKQKTVLIVGTGLGGLSTGLRMAQHGYKPVFVEKDNQPGGRLNRIEKDGFTFDMGPSFFSMSYEFKELFDYCGVTNPLRFRELDPLYAVYFKGNINPFLIHKDKDKLAETFGALEPEFRKQFDKYLARAKSVFHDTEYAIVKRNYYNIFSYVAALTSVPVKHLPMLMKSMWDELEDHFKSEEAKIIFSLVAFFLGSTPFRTPAVYSLLNYTEIEHDGYWNVEGGMYRITEEMMKLLYDVGAEFHFNTEISTYQHDSQGNLTGFTDKSGKLWQGDVYVCNADAAGFRGKILNRKKYNEKKLDSMEWTLPPFTIYLGVQGKVDSLYHHTYFLGDNFREYSSHIFTSTESPEQPYYYVNVSSKSNPDCAPAGCENIFILCPVPDLRHKKDWSDSEKLADTIVADLSERCGYDLKKHTLTRTVMHPGDWENKLNLYRGSGLGLAHGINQVGALRPANKDEVFNNLYYVGASTVPGTGLPIVVISSRLVTERILKDHGSVHSHQPTVQQAAHAQL